MTTHTVSPLLYSQVRMLAEAALGIPTGESATFTFDPYDTGGPLVVSGWAGETGGVTVPATNTTKFTDPGQVLLQVQTPAGLASLDAMRYRADAVFWSDAAVHKFVLPYLASCKGYRAAESLAKVERAWNGDIPGVQVFALMHVTGVPWAAEGAAVPVEPLWVAYLEEGRADACSLHDFASRYHGSLPAQTAPAPVPYTPPVLDRLGGAYPDYAALRSMAEWAASLDQEPMYFTYDPWARQFGPPAEQADTDGGSIVIPVFNPCVRGSRLTPSNVYFGNVDLAGNCDAVFWSTGSIEQFLLPYYASIDGFGGLRDLHALHALHASWTENRMMVGGNALEDGVEVQYLGAEESGYTTVGILHFLLSMTMSLEEPAGTALCREMGTLHADASGWIHQSRFSARARGAASGD